MDDDTMMNKIDSLIQKLYSEIKFRDVFNAQIRECDFQAAHAISELFEPYLQKLQERITKNEYQLGVNPYIEEVYERAKPPFPRIKMNFTWEPIDCDDSNLPFHDAQFRGANLTLIRTTLARFANAIGIKARL